LNILNKNVIGFDAFYSVVLEKTYEIGFDNNTMFQYIIFGAENMNANITAFYGIENDNIDFSKEDNNIEGSKIKYSDTYYAGSLSFGDGMGLFNRSYFLQAKLYFFYIIFLIILFI
jgi:hypothetical protein